MREATLQAVLAARESRVWEQNRLLSQYKLPLICFTMNIPGPIKDSPLIRRGFDEGRRRLEESLKKAGLKAVYAAWSEAVTGCEAFYAVDGDADEIKTICVAIEESDPLGRLFDMDVLDASGAKLERRGQRCCLICGAAGRGCASRRAHSVTELQSAVRRIITDYFAEAERQTVSGLVTDALLEEVMTTPQARTCGHEQQRQSQ